MATPTTAADTIATIIPYLKPLAGAVLTLTRTDPATSAKVSAAMDGVQSGVAALAASETANESAPIVHRIQQDALAVLQAAATLPLPPPFSTIVMIASFLVPSLFSAVELLMQTHTTVKSIHSG